jgi:homoprotocatechuate degradation regulator HpaR
MQPTPAAPDEDYQIAQSYPHPFQGAGHTEARQVPVLLHRARDAMATRMRSIFDPYDLTDPQWRVLRLLSIVDEIDAADLAARAFLLGPSLSRIIRDLSERGLLMRRASEEDARRFLHSITPAGMELVSEIVPQFDPLYKRIERELGIKDLQRLNTAMERLAEILSETP